MQFTLLNQENQAYWEATYIEAFPEEERLPFDRLLTSSQAGKFICLLFKRRMRTWGFC